MLAAAKRRVERQQGKVDHTRGLVNSGVLATAELKPLEEELSTLR